MPKPSFLSAVPCAALAWMVLLASACSSDTAGPAAGEQAMAGQVPGVFVDVRAPAHDMQAIAQGSRPSIEQLQRVAIMDPDGFGQPMEMMTIQVPIGWVARGGVEWNRALECVPNTWELRWSAASHDGLFELSALPRLTWQVESAGLVPSNPCPGAPMASARQYLEYVVHNARRGARVLSYRERRDIVQAMTERAAQDARPQGAQIRFEAGELLIGYALHGQEMRESMVSAVTFSQVPGSVTAWAEGGMSLRAPDGLLDFALLEHVRRSSRVNRQWQQAVDAWGMERVRRHFAPQENSIQQWQQRRMHEVNTAGMARGTGSGGKPSPTSSASTAGSSRAATPPPVNAIRPAPSTRPSKCSPGAIRPARNWPTFRAATATPGNWTMAASSSPTTAASSRPVIWASTGGGWSRCAESYCPGPAQVESWGGPSGTGAAIQAAVRLAHQSDRMPEAPAGSTNMRHARGWIGMMLGALAAVATPQARASESAAALGDAPAKAPIALALHGGAGTLDRARITPEEEAGIRAALGAALDAGHAVLAGGGSALDAVSASVVHLEDSPYFNAGKGAVFNGEGRVELDASIMDSASGKAGAVAGVTRIANPIRLARAVMEQSAHVMLIGAGAEQFAQEQGFDFVAPDYFHTPQRWQQYLDAKARASAQAAEDVGPGRYFGTVGAVALDAQGHLAAATPTGGMVMKRYGRVGDSPIIGAGTWADTQCAVSGTGWGEYFIRMALAHEICARVRLTGQDLVQAADAVVMQELPALGGNGGVIAVDAQGKVHLPFNTSGMYRASIDADGHRSIAIFRE